MVLKFLDFLKTFLKFFFSKNFFSFFFKFLNIYSQKIPGLLSIDVFPRKGIMQPSSVQSFRVKIETAGYPGRIDFHIPCVFFNASKRREYRRSIIKHNILSQELKEQFTITEEGIYVPVSN